MENIVSIDSTKSIGCKLNRSNKIIICYLKQYQFRNNIKRQRNDNILTIQYQCKVNYNDNKCSSQTKAFINDIRIICTSKTNQNHLELPTKQHTTNMATCSLFDHDLNGFNGFNGSWEKELKRLLYAMTAGEWMS